MFILFVRLFACNWRCCAAGAPRHDVFALLVCGNVVCSYYMSFLLVGHDVVHGVAAPGRCTAFGHSVNSCMLYSLVVVGHAALHCIVFRFSVSMNGQLQADIVWTHRRRVKTEVAIFPVWLFIQLVA